MPNPREKALAAERRYRAAHPDRCRRAALAWHARNLPKVRGQTAAWCKAHPQYAVAKAQRRRARLHGAPAKGVSRQEWACIVAAFGGACAYCLRPCANLQRDHLVPVSRGGADEIENLVPACRSCNASKGARLLIDRRVLSLGAS